ncbi:hypothetical protein DENSPDRAFT_627407 [Dentipellis sp. KUC8613]|nr:hypothetical protein DENSPDRAFT_627407 [Dentipellis sp. KUC8613]
MSSPDPPQIQLALTPNTTSFKRSFEEYGYDLESPVDTSVSSASSSGSGSTDSLAAGSANDGNERHKRARSGSFSSDSMGASASSHRMGASSSRNAGISGNASSTSHSPAPSTHQLPTLTPDSSPPPLHPLSNEVLLLSPEPPEVEMVDAAPQDDPPPPTIEWASSPLPSAEQFRISMERFNAFDSQISSLRSARGTMSDPARSSPSPPPTLPPLSLPSPDLDGGHPGDSQVTSAVPRPPVSHTLPSLQYGATQSSQQTRHHDIGTSTSERNRHLSLDLREGFTSLHDLELPGSSTHARESSLPDSPSVSLSERLAEIGASQLAESRRRLHNLMQPIQTRHRLPPRNRNTRPELSPLDFEDDTSSRSPLFEEMGYFRMQTTRERGREREQQALSGHSRTNDSPMGHERDERRDSSTARSYLPPSLQRDMWEHLPANPLHLPSGRDDPASSRPDGTARAEREERLRQFQHEFIAVRRLHEEVVQSSRAERSPVPRSMAGRERLGEDGDIFPDFDLPPLSVYDLRSLRDPDSYMMPDPTMPPPFSYGPEEIQPLLPNTDRHSSSSANMDSDDFEGGASLRSFLRSRRRSSPPRDAPRASVPDMHEGYMLSRASPDLRQDTPGFRPLPEIDVGSSFAEPERHSPEPSSPSPRWGSLRSWDPYMPSSSSEPTMPSARIRPRYSARLNQTASLMSENASEWRRSLARSELLGSASSGNRGRQSDRGNPEPSSTFASRDLNSFSTYWERAYASELEDPLLRRSPTPSGNPYRSRLSSRDVRRAPSPRAHARPSAAERRPLRNNRISSDYAYSSGPSYIDMRSRPDPDNSLFADDVPFSSQAAALFAARSASPPLSDSVNMPSDSRQPSHGAPFHPSRSRSPSPPSTLSSMRDIPPPPTSSSSARAHPPPPTMSEFRRRANLRSSMNATSIFPSSPPMPAAERPRPSEPRRRPFVEPSQDSPSSSSAYRNIDLNAYHEGPFRASLERWMEMDRLRSRMTHESSLSDEPPRRSRPPSLPPLQFEHAHDPWPFAGRPPSSRSNPPPSEAVISRLEEESRRASEFASIPRRTLYPTADDIPTRAPRLRPRRSPPPGASTGSSTTAEPADAARERRQMHTLFSRRPRMEAARLADDSSSSSGNPPGDGDVEGFSHAIALLRADGMSQERQQQLITRFHERSEERRLSALQWGDIEGELDAPLPPVPRLESQMRRRFGPLPPLSGEPAAGAGAESTEPRHRRGVAAARFRLPSLRNATRTEFPSARERVERIIARTAARESSRYGMRRSPGDFMVSPLNSRGVVSCY